MRDSEMRKHISDIKKKENFVRKRDFSSCKFEWYPAYCAVTLFKGWKLNCRQQVSSKGSMWGFWRAAVGKWMWLIIFASFLFCFSKSVSIITKYILHMISFHSGALLSGDVHVLHSETADSQSPYSHLCDHEVESWETSLKKPWTHCTFICYTRRYYRPPIIYAVFFRGIGDDDEQNLLDLTFRISKQPLVEPVGLLIMDPRYFKESG